MKRIRITLIVAIMLGLGYGLVSAMRNQNSYYPNPGESDGPRRDIAKALHWQPSPVWSPSYLLCRIPRNGFGIVHTKSGYLFRSEGNRRMYLIGSMILGGIMGCVAGAIILVVRRMKKGYVEQLPPGDRPKASPHGSA